MKQLILFFLVIIYAPDVLSQTKPDDKKFKLGIGGSLSFPNGGFKDSSLFGVGFEAMGTYKISNTFSVFSQIGSAFFTVKNAPRNNAVEMSISLRYHMPFIVGAEANFGRFFTGAGIGYGFWYFNEYSDGFLFSPQIGYRLDQRTQFILNYTSTVNNTANRSYVGLKVFHIIRLKQKLYLKTQ